MAERNPLGRRDSALSGRGDIPRPSAVESIHLGHRECTLLMAETLRVVSQLLALSLDHWDCLQNFGITVDLKSKIITILLVPSSTEPRDWTLDFQDYYWTLETVAGRSTSLLDSRNCCWTPEIVSGRSESPLDSGYCLWTFGIASGPLGLPWTFGITSEPLQPSLDLSDRL
ncbi:hypothetical protein PGT21_012144 [Puccinia graminis f. sp. tritici]|uniref:Uncharacterized protein n=1 Tax=Puccinia graminis f. sp. tritici TaxID=56615 RepID=A0A5B0MBR4_PUCGR|nr:hypothetical protein PGT21_012144 [Puccinia graminis f. sp. tritici]